jgi:hypothetical protein
MEATPKERWTVESRATALKSGLDFPVIDPIIFNLAPISFAFSPFLPFIPTTQNRDFVLIQIGEDDFLVWVDVLHGDFDNGLNNVIGSEGNPDVSPRSRLDGSAASSSIQLSSRQFPGLPEEVVFGQW